MSEVPGARSVSARHHLITQRLRDRRDELGLTQKQIVTRLAQCGLRTTNRALSSLEHGSGLDVGKLPELAVALDCTITYLVGLTDDPHSWIPDVPTALPMRNRPAAGASADSRRPSATPRPSSLRPPAMPQPQQPKAPAESLLLGAVIPERRFRR